MESKLKCDICGSPLIPNNIGKIIKKGSDNITICKACKEPKRRNKEKRGRGRPPNVSAHDIF